MPSDRTAEVDTGDRDERARLEALRDYVDVTAPPPAQLQAVVRLATRLTGLPHAVVNIIDEQYQRQLAAEGFDRGISARTDSMCYYTLGEGAPVHSPDAREDARWAGNPWVDGRLGHVRSYAAAPLLTPDHHALGTLCVFDDTRPQELTESQRTDLADLADLVVSIFDRERRARLVHAQEEALAVARSDADTARALQAALLPHALPSTDHVRLTARYLPGTDGAEVGGDFYDAIEAGNTFVVAMGDVQGHNASAAALMGRVRTAVRAYVSEGHDLSAVLERTNQLMQSFEGELFATCCLIALDQATGEVEVASAGHPAPLLFAPGPVRPLSVDPGPPLGVEHDAEFPRTRHRLTGRSRVLLYTDGVVEWPREAGTGEGTLEVALTAHASAPAETVADRVLAPVQHERDDDAALLVLDYSGPDPGLRETRIVLPTDTRAVRAARDHLRTTLAAWDLSSAADEAELVVSELVTNAVLHSGSPAALTLRHDREDRLLCVGVEDGSTRHPQPRDSDEDATGGRGMHIVQLLAHRWWVAPTGDGKTVWADLLVA
ncbi:SpoIIE family protein phosphatase [Kineococcus aurantiacus]|uniref:Serine phosphatase RsbU (Regulator of sigma subunit)/anti-sigma regulatory factor (Ser/Thr protein kinase) n=1 Tax=Kineococcus aurantiacus TaxID=37633 RepID=A0A7Y9J274_9ACTN|nr:serine phosphatase RsbU (regulator of sigma subunit)/anti-sigma regulatory factor (Ser/Thr protein kinase) [Kineococcus aurantiacus]